MSVTQERYSRLLFPIHKVNVKTGGELFQMFPGLRRFFANVQFPETLEDMEKMPIEYRAVWTPAVMLSILKYIVFVYDPESDLIYEYSEDLKLTKEAAAKEAGFKRDKLGEWPDWITKIMEFQDKIVVGWIIDYLKVRKNKVWADIKFAEEEIDYLNRDRANALLEGRLAKDAMRQVSERQNELQVLYKRFYAQHTDLKKVTEDEMFPITPENVFKELKIPAEIYQVRQVKDVPKEARPQ